MVLSHDRSAVAGVRTICRGRYGDGVAVWIEHGDLEFTGQNAGRDVSAEAGDARTAERDEVPGDAAVPCRSHRDHFGRSGGSEGATQGDGRTDGGDVVVGTASFNVKLEVGTYAKKFETGEGDPSPKGTAES